MITGGARADGVTEEEWVRGSQEKREKEEPKDFLESSI